MNVDFSVPTVDSGASVTPQSSCLQVLLDKYARADESNADDVLGRVAAALARDEGQHQRFQWALQAGLIPGGRIAAAAGTRLHVTMGNCFVQPLGDFIAGERAGVPGILRALELAAQTMHMGGGVGYDFSPIRPQGAWVAGTESRSSGPIGFMRVFDTMCDTIESAGARRGAQMGILRCDHPDIEAFVQAKRLPGELAHFNLSVAITDELMQAVQNDRNFELVHVARPFEPALRAHQRPDGAWIYRSVRARVLWDGIVRAAHASGEPGVLFIDTIARRNNLSDIESISASNPCGEQPLPPWGACVLGSIDLTRVIRNPFTCAAAIDWSLLRRLVTLGVELLDRALDVSIWPLPQQAEQVQAKRRIGLGFMGLGDALLMLGHRYDSLAARELASSLARYICHAAYRSSIALARQLGPFPLFDAARFLAEPHFASTLPEDLKAEIARHGLRNSHLLAIAPTGSIALAFADNVSSGIEPVFAASCARLRRMPDGRRTPIHLLDHAIRVWQSLHTDANAPRLPPAFVTALQMRAADQLAMVASVAPFIDAGISKTVNLPRTAPLSETAETFSGAWRAGLSGITVYRADTPSPGAATESD